MLARTTRRTTAALLGSAAAAVLTAALPVAPAAAVPPGANGIYACTYYAHGAPFALLFTFDPAAGTLSPLPRTTEDSFDSAPSWAPDGRRLAHVGDPDGPGGDDSLPNDIFTYDLRTGARANLTRTPELQEAAPAWSPDGGRIAYTTQAGWGGVPTLMVVAASGGTPRPLGQGAEPAWSPDGSRLAFVRGGEIYTMGADGQDVRRITYDADEDSSPSWSPDGTRLAWASPYAGAGQDIWIADASNGRGVYRITYSAEMEYQPVWSPDGTQVAFSREGQGGYGAIWSTTLATAEERLLAEMCFDGDWQRLNRPPSAGFTTSPDPPTSGQTLQLRSTASDPDGPLASQVWDTDGDGFDDGSGETASRVLRAGERSVRIRLRVRDVDGAEATAEQTVTVGNRRPSAAFTTSNAAPRVGQAAVFTSTSSDPDGPLAALAWDLDGDGAFDDGNGVTAQRAFAFAGIHIVRLQVTDADGAVDVATLALEVTAPGTAAGGPQGPPPSGGAGVMPPPPSPPPAAPVPPAGPGPPVAAPPVTGPAPAPAPAPRPAAPSRFALAVPSVATARGNAVAVRITCPAACRGTVRIETRSGRARGRLAFRLSPGTTTVRVPVSRATLRQARRAPVRLRAVATLQQGATRTTTRRNFTLRVR